LGTICAQDCTTDPCATGFTCNANKLCAAASSNHATTTTTSGCAAAPGNADAGLFAGIIAGALAIAGRRRKRKINDTNS
jgi:MYXO-CTERM domain-containing protein